MLSLALSLLLVALFLAHGLGICHEGLFVFAFVSVLGFVIFGVVGFDVDVKDAGLNDESDAEVPRLLALVGSFGSFASLALLLLSLLLLLLLVVVLQGPGISHFDFEFEFESSLSISSPVGELVSF